MPEAITTTLWLYALKEFAEQLNVLNVYDDRITPMEKFAGTTTNINIKSHHIWGCPVYILDSRLQGNISGLHNWEPRSGIGIYLGHSPFHAG